MLLVLSTPAQQVNHQPVRQLQDQPGGSITLYVQKDSPGKGKESHWLPAPSTTSQFVMLLRINWWPKDRILTIPIPTLHRRSPSRNDP
ncbi:DUF1214 domain-containing protein [Synechococcus sp. J7-Johnson]|uniref:DUF1214 domain-containing protein n=1 Tax=Synechococcus sp. J7-Johnson TaxID=2823737 RepID=UPI0037DA4E53